MSTPLKIAPDRPGDETLGDRIKALRAKLGSVTRPLSFRDMARILSDQLPEGQRVPTTSLHRWEQNDGEPPVAVLAVMARLAGVSFEEFALGPQPQPTPRSGEGVPIYDGPPSVMRRAEEMEDELRRKERAARKTR